MHQLVVTRTAQKEADDIALQFARKSLLRANRFLEAIDDTYRHLCSVPETGSKIEELAGTSFAGVRHCTIKRFRDYLVVYRFIFPEIEVLHIVDGRRNYLELFDEG